MTSYVVLARDDSGFWRELGVEEAHHANAAVQQLLPSQTEKDGTYVAIPERSWNPVTVEIEVRERVKFS